MADFEFNGEPIEVRTLTVAEIHSLVKNASKKEAADIIELLFDDDIPTDALLMATGLDFDDLIAEGIEPQEIRRLLDEVKKKNPFFVAMMGRAVAAVEQIKGSASSGPSVA